MNLFFQHARFMFGCMAMEMIQPLLLNAVEDQLGQKPREVLQYLLEGYTSQVSKEESKTLQLGFETFFELLSQAHEELGGQSWFDMFVTKPNEADEGKLAGVSSTKAKEEAQSWFDFCCTQAANLTKATDWAVMDVATTGDKARPADEEGGYDRRLYFLIDLFSRMPL